MTRSEPMVSVVMAVHNGSQYLREAVDSVLAQTFADFEFVIVDDGSTDATADILRDYARRDARVRVLRQNNHGLTRSLNGALALCRGAYIARMDADDVSLPTRLAQQVEYLADDKECVIVGTRVLMIDPDGAPLAPLPHFRDHEEIDRQFLLGYGAALSHPAVMIRKTALDAIGGYDERFITGQDLDLFLRLCEIGKAHNLDDVLLLWRQHPGSVCRTRRGTWAEVKSLAIKGAIERRGVESYLRTVFHPSVFSTNADFEERCLRFALSSGNLRTGFKYLARVVQKQGFAMGHLTIFLRLVAKCIFRPKEERQRQPNRRAAIARRTRASLPARTPG